MADKLPTLQECEVIVADMEPEVLVKLALGGRVECAATEDTGCCSKVNTTPPEMIYTCSDKCSKMTAVLCCYHLKCQFQA